MISDLEDDIQNLYGLYNDIKRDIKNKDSLFYERWKAGGFIIDEDVLSMYPCLSDFQCNDEKDDEENIEWNELIENEH